MAVKIDVKSYVNRDRTKDVLDYINENDRIVKRNNRKTNEEFIEEVKALVGDKYTVLSEYVNAKTPIPIKHNTCGNIHNFTPNDFLSGTRCPACFRNFRKTQKQFEKEVCDKVGKEYTVLGKYKNTHTKIKMRHNCDRCSNYEYEVLPSAFLKGERCPACYKMTSKHTNEDFVKKVFELVGDEYTFLEPYITANTKIKVRHNCDNCGNYEYMVKPTKFVDRGCRCPKCQGEVPVSQEEFEQRVKNQVGDEYTVIGNIVKMNAPIKIRHNCPECGNYEFDMSPSIFLRKKNKCPKCFVRKEQRKPGNFYQNVKEIYGDKYTILGKYIDYKTKILVKCNDCGLEKEIVPTQFISSPYGCPGCNKVTTEKFRNRIKNMTNNEYDFEGEYVNSVTKLKFKHLTCGTEFICAPAVFIQKQRCPLCTKKKIIEKNSLSTKEFTNRVKEKYQDEYSVLGNYVNQLTKIKMKHNKCGTIWDVQPRHFLYDNTGCPECAKKSKLSTEDYKNIVKDLVGDEYTVLGDFVNVTTKIKMRHNCKNCNNYEYEVTPDSFKYGHRCPKCITPRGEVIIEKYLKDHNINYKTQFGFDDCRYKSKLLFDFAIFYPDGDLALLVEFQGLQHYCSVEKWDTKDQNIYTRLLRDKRKRDYCSKKFIPLLEFSYRALKRNSLEQELDEVFKPLMEFLLPQNQIKANKI